MKTSLSYLITGGFLCIAFLVPQDSHASNIEKKPVSPLQGEPLMITLTATSTAKSVTVFGKVRPIFLYKGKQTVLVAVDLNKSPGTYTITALLSNGMRIDDTVTVRARPRVEAPLGIPQTLGGNTVAAADTLVSTLALENASLLGLRTGTHAFWSKAFTYPVSEPVVTDPYGYKRTTGMYSIAHRGTDFRAPTGTPVLSMNRGVVRLVQEGRNYGKTVIIDHGLGVQTFYMHLSRILVQEGELVLPGQRIGLSGATGYAEQAHLHTTVRIGEISIDPVVFLGLFN